MKMLTRLLALTMALLMCVLPALAESSPEDMMATVDGSRPSPFDAPLPLGYPECTNTAADGPISLHRHWRRPAHAPAAA
jgi:hypothetical protein